MVNGAGLNLAYIHETAAAADTSMVVLALPHGVFYDSPEFWVFTDALFF